MKRRIYSFVLCALLLAAPAKALESFHYEEPISTGYSISAEVIAPEVDALCGLTLTKIDYTSFDIASLPISLPADAGRNMETNENPSGKVCVFDRDGKYLFITSTGIFQYENPSGKLAWSAESYSVEEVDMSGELSCMSRDAARAGIADALRLFALGDTDCYALSAMDKAAYDQLYESGREWQEADLAEGFTKMGATEWYDWPTEDVCYIANCAQLYGGVPLFPFTNVQMSSSDLGKKPSFDNGPSIVTYYFPDGVGWITIKNAYTCAPSGDALPVLTFEEAVEKLKEKGAPVLSLNDMVVNRIWLSYFVFKEGEVYTARPAWVFETKKIRPDGKRGRMYYDVLNAWTGEWL